MIFIIEGADGAGKSTLAKKLSESLEMPIIKMNKPEKHEEAGMFEYYRRLLTLKDYFILDRCWYSELIYGNIMPDRAQPCITMEQCEELERIAADKAMIIHCTASVEELWKRCNVRGEEYVTDFSQMLKIRAGYIELFKNTSLPLLTYEFKNLS